MKKTLLLAAAALLGLSANAAVTYYKLGTPVESLDALQSGKYFISVISKNKENLFKSVDSDGAISAGFATIDAKGTLDTSLLWNVEVTEADGDTPKSFSLQNVSTEKYLSTYGWQDYGEGKHNVASIASTDENFATRKAQYTFAEPVAEYTGTVTIEAPRFNVYLANGSFQGSGTTTYFHTNDWNRTGQRIGYWSGNGTPGSGSCCLVALIPVIEEEVNAVNVTVNFPALNGNTVQKVFAAVDLHSDIKDAIKEAVDFNIESISPENSIVSETNNTFTVTGTWGYTAVEFNKVYRLKIRNKQYIAWNGTDKSVTNNGTDANAMNPDRLWYFKDCGKTDAGAQKVTLHCMALEDEYGITVNNVNNAISSMTTSPTVFTIVSNNNFSTDASAAYYGGFSLQHPDNANGHVNDVNDQIGLWTAAASRNDDGSCFRIFALTDADFDNLHSASDKDETILAAAKASHSVTDVRAYFDAVYPKHDELLDGYYTIQYAQGNEDKYFFTSKAYGDAEGNISDEEDARQVWQADKDGSLSQLWQFKAYKGHEGDAYNTYVVANPNSNDFHLGTPASDGEHRTFVTREAQWGVKLYLHKNAEGQWVAQVGKANNYLNRDNVNGRNIITWSGSFGDVGNLLNITKVETVSVEIPEGQNYTTVCFPFAVTTAAKVYTAEKTIAATNSKYYVKIVDAVSTIPANTGVIVEGTGTVTFNIVNAVAQDETASENLLTGVTVARHVDAAETHFSLADGKFSKNTEAQSVIPANSAILSMTAVPEAHQATPELLLTTVDDPTTSINEIGVAGKAVKFYDLQGREVANPVNGIYITSEGTKVLVK